MTEVTELSPPSWLDNVFIEKALRSGECDASITVISSEVKAATVAGDNYASDMYRAVVQLTRGGQPEEKSIIIKAAKDAANGEMNKILHESTVFDHEINTFSVVFPAMYRLFKEASIQTWQPFGAKYFYSHQTTAIVLEDLKKLGFRLAETKSGLDLSHCLLVMRTIARYHAASVVLYQKNPESFKPFLTNAFIDGSAESFESVLKNNVINIAKVINTWSGYKNRLSDKLNKISERVLDHWVSTTIRDESSFNVLTHGDLWMNNMMFRYSDDTGEVVDVRFVDFQLSHWTSPAVDLQYFLNSSANVDLLEKFDKLIEEYHDTFCETLTLLGYKHLQPTLANLNQEMEKRGLLGVLTTFFTRSVALGDRSKVPDFNKLLTNEGNIYLSEEYLASLKKLMPMYENRGWI